MICILHCINYYILPSDITKRLKNKMNCLKPIAAGSIDGAALSDPLPHGCNNVLITRIPKANLDADYSLRDNDKK